jgi:HK97 family phage prohead protease
MSWRQTEVVTTVRAVAADSREIEGIAVPYGIVATDTEVGREAFAPGAFRGSVEHWMGRQDGARMAYRSAHKQEPVGVVTSLEDTPAGVKFRATIDEGDDGDKYLRRVRSGLNGVSVEFAPGSARPRPMRDGTVLHREARMFAIAGSVSPAYDGARIALRDMEDPDVTDEKKTDEKVDEKKTDEKVDEKKTDEKVDERDAKNRSTELTTAERDRLEAAYAAGRSHGQGLSTIRITRAEAVYGRDATPGPRGEVFSFLRDNYAATHGDSAAAERQTRHYAMLTDIAVQMERAGDVLSSEIPGAYPNDYLPGLLTPRILKGRPMGSFFNRFPISDGRPKIFAKVTTSTTVAVQSAEGANPAASDFATTSVTATPLLYGAETVVSRQVLDGADPAAETMVLNDMIEAYAQASETVIKTAVEAGASASGTPITAATPFAGALGNIIKYYATRFKPATGQFVPSALFSVLLAEADTTGRPKMPLLNPVNSDGSTAPGAVSGSILSATDFLSYASTVNVVVTTRPEDYVIFESPIARFSYDAVTGPSGVRMGIWAYLVVGTRLGGLSVTAA